MTEQELADLERLADAATPGPWRAVAMNGVAGVAAPDHMRCYVYIHGRSAEVSDETVARWQRDAHLIAAARTAVPALIEEVRRLRNALASISLDEYESTSSASEKVHGHARIARRALYVEETKP